MTSSYRPPDGLEDDVISMSLLETYRVSHGKMYPLTPPIDMIMF